jgi:hypothetical protein
LLLAAFFDYRQAAKGRVNCPFVSRECGRVNANVQLAAPPDVFALKPVPNRSDGIPVAIELFAGTAVAPTTLATPAGATQAEKLTPAATLTM